MKHGFYKIVLLMLLMQGCADSPKPKVETRDAQQPDLSLDNSDTVPTAKPDTCFKPTDENELPPFKYACPCDLYQFGEYKTSDSTRHIYVRGKNWNPHLNACTFSFYEGAYNVSLDQMKAVKIHLLDVEKFTIPGDDTEYGKNEVKDKIILVFQRQRGAKDTVVYDPYNTGKYHRK